ncbi:phosphopyruvate hydratase [Erythrobacter sp. W53]|uniref:phosphopyruvate hydratase n=1 Tax=Erythrobacter sp. W53 TaxID=3425947 RepID=UPI003D767FAE
MITSAITDVVGRRVWDSRGRPTVEVEIALESGAIGRAIAPAGASRGSREAIDLRDGGEHLAGYDVGTAVAQVAAKIAPSVKGLDAADQRSIDDALIALDGTKTKSVLGGNAMVATSLAVLHAAAADAGIPLWKWVAQSNEREPTIPLPEIQIFGGGAHAGRRVDIQDFMVMVPGAADFEEVMEVTSNIYRAAGRVMEEKGGITGVADEGGWWPNFDSNEEALECLVRAIEMAGEIPGERVVISLDIAASEFFENGEYRLALEDRAMDADGQIELLESWLDKYPIASIEDPLAETDKEGMRAFTQAFGERVQIIGDDYLVTNAALVEEAASDGACNAVLIKVNQAGTVSESIDAYHAAQAAGFGTIVSARSGESEDTSISHLSAGLNARQLKVGSFTRSERMAKWNECLRMQCQPGMGGFVGGEALANTWWGRSQ